MKAIDKWERLLKERRKACREKGPHDWISAEHLDSEQERNMYAGEMVCRRCGVVQEWDGIDGCLVVTEDEVLS